MWIVSWDLFLMKVLVKKEVCVSCEQCTDPLESTETHFSMKKKVWNAKNADALNIISTQTGTNSYE